MGTNAQGLTQGGAAIIKLRGRSSFQSPSYLSVEMIRSVMGGAPFAYPAGTYVKNEKYQNIMMAMDTTLDQNGCSYKVPTGTAEEVAALDASYAHLARCVTNLLRSTSCPPWQNGTRSTPISNRAGPDLPHADRRFSMRRGAFLFAMRRAVHISPVGCGRKASELPQRPECTTNAATRRRYTTSCALKDRRSVFGQITCYQLLVRRFSKNRRGLLTISHGRGNESE